MKKIITFEEFLAKVEKGSFSEGELPKLRVLELLQGKWTTQVLYLICVRGKVRFGEFKRELKEITNTVLTSTLRELETEGIIERKQYNEIPPHVEYFFSKKGRDLYPIFYQMMIWEVKYKDNEQMKAQISSSSQPIQASQSLQQSLQSQILQSPTSESPKKN